MTWQINQTSKAKITNPVLIEGLPGMGNVGKIAVDFLIDALAAKKVYEISSNTLPHCVFVNEENMVELPEIEVFHKQIGKRSFLFLSGDTQPLDETSCYEFCHKVLDTFEKGKGKEIITLGGLGLSKIPDEPKVYCTGNDKNFIQKFIKAKTVSNEIHGVIGPIVGVSGLLTGLAGKRKIPAVSLLAETFGHPNYLGVKGAKELLKVLDKEYKLKLDLSELEDDIDLVDKPINKKLKKSAKLKAEGNVTTDTNYIG